MLQHRNHFVVTMVFFGQNDIFRFSLVLTFLYYHGRNMMKVRSFDAV